MALVPAGPTQLAGQRVAEALDRALPGIVTVSNDEWVEVAPARVDEALHWLHDSEEFDAAQLSSLCAVDYHDHFAVVYHLQSLDLNHQIVLKARVSDHEEPALPSSYPIYKGALLQEREVYDLMGIRFEGHPDLRRIFLWDGFPGHPLRKDFMGIGQGLTSGLRRFPFEDKANPDRQLNRDNLIGDEQDVPSEWSGTAPA
ncbi:MAG: NADH-quinone oxidoreductase subunit C [Chloroflexi bacterium]|nr:NADH-quinone oxidoreductase subunit C [Chloroflexota bacterium]MDA1147756.1 NADH-quinone oxidoreductase subunit C [Chloroflexota bacterium]